MKYRNILSIALAVFISTIGFSQENENKLSLGFHVGVNFASLSNFDDVGLVPGTVSTPTSEDPIEARTSFNLGLSLERHFSDVFGLKAKVIYDRKGYGNVKRFGPNEYPLVSKDFSMDYLTFPVQATLRPSFLPDLYIGLGPYAGILVSSKVVADNDANNDFIDIFEKFDAGIAGTIGYSLLLNNSLRIFIEYDIQFGLIDVFNSPLNRTARLWFFVCFNLRGVPVLGDSGIPKSGHLASI